jgi:hypothetical protein
MTQIRGQGYDGASNMKGDIKGLKNIGHARVTFGLLYQLFSTSTLASSYCCY